MNKLTKTYLSVDCTLFAYDGKQLNVLLISREENGHEDFKLPGSLVYEDENVDQASSRVLYDLTGLQSVKMMQYHTFSDIHRIGNDDKTWSEHFYELREPLNRIVSVGYVALLRLNSKLQTLSNDFKARWVPLAEVPQMPFDHNTQLEVALDYIRKMTRLDESMVFGLLPQHFTLLQLRQLHELIYNKQFDVRNFSKRMLQKPYLVETGEKESGVAHRSARLYKFDRKKYRG